MKLLTQNKRNIFVFGAISASIGYLFSIKLTSLGIIVFLISWLLNFKNLKLGSFIKKNVLHLLVVFLLFLLLGSTYSVDLQQAQEFIVRHLAFLLLPLVFLTIKPFNSKECNIIIKIFVYAVTLFFIICALNAVYRQVTFTNQGGPFNWYFFYRYDFLEIFEQHPTYVSMYALLSLSFILDSGRKLFKRNWLRIFLLFAQVFAIVLYGSRIGYIILIILFSIYALKGLKLKPKKEKGKLGLIYLVVIIILLIASWNIPIVKERILFTFGYQQDYKFNNQETIKNGSPEKQGRLLLWKDALKLVKEKPLFGYGTGSNKVVLAQEYKERGHLLFLKKRYNSHNTYLDLLLIGGIPLLLLYLVILGVLLYEGIREKNYVLLSFFLIISITALTETIFRSQGIVFFAFFYCLLLSTRKNNE